MSSMPLKMYLEVLYRKGLEILKIKIYVIVVPLFVTKMHFRLQRREINSHCQQSRLSPSSKKAHTECTQKRRNIED